MSCIDGKDILLYLPGIITEADMRKIRIKEEGIVEELRLIIF